uniref:CMP/dCMP-type deaminase domain-containing protein n=1 Tax=Noctiluca scintillans TaxID=2966 RepID=A0A7S1F9K1_NOCSC
MAQVLTQNSRPLSLRSWPSKTMAELSTAAHDAASAHKLREMYVPPKQSNFRVAAVLRFVRADGTQGIIKAVNAEPHDANIRGAICAERAALCQFQRDEADGGARVTRVVCVTDAPDPIYPGPCCREFLRGTCDGSVEVIASGSRDPSTWEMQPLAELLPLPSVYCGLCRDTMLSRGEALSTKVAVPLDEHLASAYRAAVAHAKRQQRQSVVFPLLFAAAVRFEDGRLHTVAELKGIEYGCTVDAVSLLMPEMLRCREEGGASPVCIVQADQYGVAHAPFAAARSLLAEHGFGDVLVSAHGEDGTWSDALSVTASLPHASHTTMFD